MRDLGSRPLMTSQKNETGFGNDSNKNDCPRKYRDVINERILQRVQQFDGRSGETFGLRFCYFWFRLK